MIPTTAEAALTLARSIELTIAIKATVLLALGLLSARLAWRARASVRHLALAATFAALIALPLIVLAAPGVTIDVPVSYTSGTTPPSTAGRVSEAVVPAAGGAPGVDTLENRQRAAISWTAVVRAGWIAGTALLLAPVAIALWRFGRIRRAGLPWPELREIARQLATKGGIRRSVDVLQHEDIPAPFTFGVWRPAIVLPFDARHWSDGDLRRTLIHELEHVRRNDWAVQLASRAICACYWFHPLVWAAWRRLCLEAERACDDAVVNGAERTDYAEQLVLLAQRLSATDAQFTLGMANRSDLSTRVSAVLDAGLRRGPAGLWTAAGAMIAASVVVLAIAPVRAVAKAENAVAAATHDSPSQRARPRRVPALDRALYEAAEDGDLAEVDQVLQAGANVNAALDGDGSPLIAAARSGRIAVVRRLLDRGADPNMAVEGDGNPIIMAAHEGFADVVALLLDRGASIDQMVPGDENALIQASGRGHLPVVKLLVDRRADVNARVWADSAFERPNGEWRTPLSMARKGGHAAVVAFLLAAGARE